MSLNEKFRNNPGSFHHNILHTTSRATIRHTLYTYLFALPSGEQQPCAYFPLAARIPFILLLLLPHSFSIICRASCVRSCVRLCLLLLLLLLLLSFSLPISRVTFACGIIIIIIITIIIIIIIIPRVLIYIALSEIAGE